MQFGNLKGADIAPQSKSKFVFYGLLGEPWLMAKPAHEINKPYFNSLLKRNASRARRGMLNKTLDVAMIERNRAEDRELFAKHIVNEGPWGGWVDNDGVTEVPFSQEKVEKLMQELPAEQFDELRGYCLDLNNFRPDVVSGEDAEESGKNS